MQSPILEIKDLEITFPGEGGSFPVVRNVSFSVGKGETLALVGESGSGKSLTGLAVTGLIPSPGRITSGRVFFDGRDLTGLNAGELGKIRGREIGMVFQEPMTSLDPVYTVGFHLKEALTSHMKLSPGEVRERSVALLNEAGIPEPEARLKVYPHQLSGGLRQRVMIACALAMGPRLLIADEPTTALDVTVEAGIMALIGSLQKSREMAVLFITHDLGLVARHAGAVAVMYAGHIVEKAETRALFGNPLHPYTKALFASMPSGTGKGRLKPIEGTVPKPGRMPPGCPFSDRCPEREAACLEKVPEPADRLDGRYVRCIKAGGRA